MLRLGPLTATPIWRPQLSTDLCLEGRFVLEKKEVEKLLTDNAVTHDTLLQALLVHAAKLALPYLSGFYVG